MRKHLILTLALTTLVGVPAIAQDRNNEDEVVKVDARSANHNYRDGEIIVKFKEQSAARINAQRRTKFKSSGVSGIDAALRELGVTDVEELMPLSGSQQLKRQAKAFNGQTVVATPMNRLYLMHYDKTKVRNVVEAVAKLSKLQDVEYTEPNLLVYALGTTAAQPNHSMALKEAQNEAGETVRKP